MITGGELPVTGNPEFWAYLADNAQRLNNEEVITMQNANNSNDDRRAEEEQKAQEEEAMRDALEAKDDWLAEQRKAEKSAWEEHRAEAKTYEEVIAAFEGHKRLKLKVVSGGESCVDTYTYDRGEIGQFTNGLAAVETDDAYGLPCMGYVLEIIKEVK